MSARPENVVLELATVVIRQPIAGLDVRLHSEAEFCGNGCQSAFGGCGTPKGPRFVERCTQPNTIAITFDDGPYKYTASLLDQFDREGYKLTLFVNGNNWGCIYDYANELQSAYRKGHQIASHTWSHQNLSALSATRIQSEMTQLDDALQKIIGAAPLYVRPPFGEYNGQTLNVLGNLGYRVVTTWTADSGDTWQNTNFKQQKEHYEELDLRVPQNVLNHDTVPSTVDTLVPWVLQWVKSKNLKVVTLGECLGESKDKWYKNVGPMGQRDASWKC
ncbi:hypothetical protein HK104_009878 [Borealophlyctis nickersoniae]|nr:hypothetical protein HK104_009878 [Borealophlyctis nickersoniae]